MPGERIELEDLLRDQDRATAALEATIEPVDDDPDRVRITPFVPNVGCMCSVALTVRKEAIGSLVRTDEHHKCCGKTLGVVEVELTDETLKDVFSQLVNAMSMNIPTPHHPPASQDDPFSARTGRRALRSRWGFGVSRNLKCQEDYEACMGSAYDEFDRCMCGNGYNACIFPPRPQVFCPPPGF